MSFLTPGFGWYHTPVQASSAGLQSPSDIWGSNAYWWDPSDTGHITIATGVSSWYDRSGTYAVTNSLGTAQPTYNASLVDSKPGIVFDSTDFLISNLQSGLTGSSFTLIVLVKYDSTVLNGCQFGISNGSTNALAVLDSGAGANWRAGFRNLITTTTVDDGAIDTVNYHTLIARLPSTGTGSLIVDGQVTLAGTAFNGNIHSATNTISFGCTPSGNARGRCSALDVILVRGDVTNAQLNSLAAWSHSRYPSLTAWTTM